ncbi:23S rRNA pseudouridine(2604) synthase RluF [Vibrio sp. S9_S30]|uniref:23S rRNA pseudouridine(2604) synthase RluF n=1 Tax=Vibrio sp. S9_S30 TaxID=2720226 RepID=UPI00167FEB92|nr:23S rRNA pseudouridine(2604) synthase RluF [Vibrio sp. S9_S30]MBD1555875.1 23S rRNA pseudouridine(2604) synthase RluF [Vibrio sp. S9_S30]
MSQTSEAKRLNKFISETGYCSRREADKLIEQGRVTINGELPEMGVKVLPTDDVLIDGNPLRQKEKPIYIALNKPTGITCTTERHVEGNIIDFVGHRKRIFPIGRLDKPSDGLIFLTNDGDIVNKILRAGNSHEKEYVVRVDKPITQEFLDKMGSGVEILDTVTLPCQISKETKFSFRIVLTQGLNRQIRRMCEALGFEVFKLRRVRIMNISLDGIPNGKWRYLTDEEVADIHRLCESSVGTEEASRADSRGKKIEKATDAKLYDHRQKEHAEPKKFKTFKGKGTDFHRRANKGGEGQTARHHNGTVDKSGNNKGSNSSNHGQKSRRSESLTGGKSRPFKVRKPSGKTLG